MHAVHHQREVPSPRAGRHRSWWGWLEPGEPRPARGPFTRWPRVADGVLAVAVFAVITGHRCGQRTRRRRGLHGGVDDRPAHRSDRDAGRRGSGSAVEATATHRRGARRDGDHDRVGVRRIRRRQRPRAPRRRLLRRPVHHRPSPEPGHRPHRHGGGRPRDAHRHRINASTSRPRSSSPGSPGTSAVWCETVATIWRSCKNAPNGSRPTSTPRRSRPSPTNEPGSPANCTTSSRTRSR